MNIVAITVLNFDDNGNFIHDSINIKSSDHVYVNVPRRESVIIPSITCDKLFVYDSVYIESLLVNEIFLKNDNITLSSNIINTDIIKASDSKNVKVYVTESITINSIIEDDHNVLTVESNNCLYDEDLYCKELIAPIIYGYNISTKNIKSCTVTCTNFIHTNVLEAKMVISTGACILEKSKLHQYIGNDLVLLGSDNVIDMIGSEYLKVDQFLYSKSIDVMKLENDGKIKVGRIRSNIEISGTVEIIEMDKLDRDFQAMVRLK